MEATVRITRVGNALAAIIPKALAERMKLKKGDLVEIQIKKRIFPVVELTDDLAVRAGELHAELRRKQRDIPLADCVIMAHAEQLNAHVITLDNHFYLWKGSIVLGD